MAADANLLASLAEVEEKDRFFMELEFVQCLSQPYYLKFLADGRYLQDEAFVNYLSYLRYWKQPQYAKYLIYPQCLHFLDLLQDPLFRTYCAAAPNIEFIARQVANHWKFARNNRLEAAAAIPLPPDPTSL